MVEFYKKKLKNGLTVLFEKRELPIISIALAVRFGSSYEPEEEKGVAHFIEHMLFKGTEKRNSKEIIYSITEKGGEYNAFTAKTLTAAWMKLPSKYLEFSVELMSDLFLNSQFGKSEVEKERTAILEEIKMYHDEPFRHVFEELSKLMYEKPFATSTLGTEDTVSKFSEEDLIKKYKENYFTSNFILVVVGNADFKKIIEICERCFTEEKKKQSAKIIFPKIKRGDLIEERNELDQAHLAVGIHFPNISDKKRYSAEIFNSIFSQGPSSRIFQEVREKRGLAYAIYGTLDQELSHGEGLLYIGTSKENAENVKKIILSEFEKMKDLSKIDLEKEKLKLISSKILEKEDSKNVLVSLLLEEVSDKAENYYDYENLINSVKLEEVRKLAQIKNLSCFSLVPKI